MPAQKSQKGRLSAAQQREEISRFKSGVPGRKRLIGQQFGGVSQRVDEDRKRLSGRAERAIAQKVTRAKPDGGQ